MRYAIGIWVLTLVAIYLGYELLRVGHPSFPWVKRRRARRLRWQWARRPAGTGDREAPPPTPAATQE